MKLGAGALLFGGLLLMLVPILIAVARSKPWKNRPDRGGGDGGPSSIGGGYDSDGGGDGGGD